MGREFIDRAPGLGISAIATYKPQWVLPNAWFADLLSRKFVKHTGIHERPVSLVDEVGLGVIATRRLFTETACDPRDCAGVVLVSPSFVPMAIANRFMPRARARDEQLSRAAVRMVRELGLQPRCIRGINSFCCGYVRALALAAKKLAPSIGLRPTEFLLVVTASQISRITNYSCAQTAPLFGDFATASLVAPVDSPKYPARVEIIASQVERTATTRSFFDFQLKSGAVRPNPDGGQEREKERVVFTMDGMGVADHAPRAMALAAARTVRQAGIAPEQIELIVPHQAGEGIVRFTEMKMRDAGFRGEFVNGLTSRLGNVSSCSIPYALTTQWDRLSGYIASPAAAVGQPGKPYMYQGCIIFRARHAARMRAA